MSDDPRQHRATPAFDAPIQPGEFDDSLNKAVDFAAVWVAKIKLYIRIVRRGRGIKEISLGDAERWLLSADFRAVCAMLGVDPKWLLDKTLSGPALEDDL